MQIIVNSLWALFMKMQVSVSEATDCLRKMIGGESMGNWFENMEPMNIQEERAKTKKAEEELEESVKAMFKLLKKLCPTKEQAVQELIESYDKTEEEEAQKLVEQYWWRRISCATNIVLRASVLPPPRFCHRILSIPEPPVPLWGTASLAV